VDFFESLLPAGQLQLLLGELVKTKAQSAQVKYVATTLGSTQARENEQIARLAAENGLSLSAAVAGAQRQTSAELEKLSGAAFDIACVDKIIDANRKTVHGYEEGAESQNPEIKSFSELMLPVARDRLRIAEKMITGGQTPKSGVATPAPQTFPVQLRPPPPYIPGKPAAATPATPAARSATAKASPAPAPLTLEQKPDASAGPFPAPPAALPTPPPLTGAPVPRRVIDRFVTPAPATPAGPPAAIPPPIIDGAAPPPPNPPKPATPKP
jgi:predicted outer membrane protein